MTMTIRFGYTVRKHG